MSVLLYLGPSLGLGTIITVLVICALVLFSLGYVVWLNVKKFFKKKDSDVKAVNKSDE